MDWHSRYLQQARWTKQLRDYLFNQLEISKAPRLLEVGCGTGAIMSEFVPSRQVFGVDIKFSAVEEAKKNAIGSLLTVGDGAALPYDDCVFSAAFCHFLLLWVHDPLEVVREMRRVVKPGGVVLVLAEPDYSGRIEHPPAFIHVGTLQTQSLIRQGADPQVGRKIGGILNQSGVRNVHAGVLGGEWLTQFNQADWEIEWQVLQDDLAHASENIDFDDLKRLDAEARQSGERILFVPTFYAWGIV